MIRSETGRKALAVVADVAVPADVERMVRETVERFGRIDILCNNAGIGSSKDVVAVEPDEWDQVFAVNVRGVYLGCKYALPHMLAQGGGAIINTASVTAYDGNPNLIDYSASKGAVIAFTRSLAKNLAERGIRVNAVAPGPIWTPLIPSTFAAEDVATFGSDTPMKRPGQPSELAAAYVFLASEDSTYMTGQTLHLNGGKIVNG